MMLRASNTPYRHALLQRTPLRAPRPLLALPHPRPRLASTNTPAQQSRATWLAPYMARLRQSYPHVDPPSLLISFVILHELTALVPLVGLFALLKWLGVGGAIVARVVDETSEAEGERSGWRTTAKEWLVESEKKAERVGRRYGWFGWAKETQEEREERRAREKDAQVGDAMLQDVSPERLRVSGDVANAAASYLLVKALLPLRILVSLRLSPSLANVIVKNFRSLRERGRKYVPAGEGTAPLDKR
ncbi:hypothetical protein OF846_001075 [Rhodotorula toruloides]|nr:hypothetical protein OF846_001075 [Rhodotorula toruloides]